MTSKLFQWKGWPLLGHKAHYTSSCKVLPHKLDNDFNSNQFYLCSTNSAIYLFIQHYNIVTLGNFILFVKDLTIIQRKPPKSENPL